MILFNPVPQSATWCPFSFSPRCIHVIQIAVVLEGIQRLQYKTMLDVGRETERSPKSVMMSLFSMWLRFQLSEVGNGVLVQPRKTCLVRWKDVEKQCSPELMGIFGIVWLLRAVITSIPCA